MSNSYIKKTIVGQLNINSLRNNFLSVKELLSHNLDWLIINEMKLNDSFPNAQFKSMATYICAEIGTFLLEVSVFT